MRGIRSIASLRSKLVAAFVLIIFLSLLLASGSAVLLLRDYQTKLRLKQLEDIASSMSFQSQMLERSEASPEQAASVLRGQADEAKVRFLLLDRQGMVVGDSQDGLRGQKVSLPGDLLKRGPPQSRPYTVAYRDERSGENLSLIIAGMRPPSPAGERFVSPTPAYFLALAVPEQSIAAAWLEMAPGLSLAALISLIVSVVVALLLAGSISRPISAVTKASEEMAGGNYDQSIAAKSRDEIGRMAVAFNTMAAQVKASHRTLRDFLANVSHELRTPLTSIQGFSQALVDGAIKDAEGYAAAGQIIYEESERMRRLVEDLLFLSKIDAGQIPLNKLPVDLEALIASCVKRVEIRARQTEVHIIVQADGLPAISGDAHKLEQAFTNLLDNALKYTPKDGVVTVTGSAAAGSLRGQPLARITIHNTGPSIPGEELARIFERFYRLDKSRARTDEGSGLGLAIVQEIVQAHGGFVEVRSESPNGTAFSVYLPVTSEDQSGLP